MLVWLNHLQELQANLIGHLAKLAKDDQILKVQWRWLAILKPNLCQFFLNLIIIIWKIRKRPILIYLFLEIPFALNLTNLLYKEIVTWPVFTHRKPACSSRWEHIKGWDRRRRGKVELRWLMKNCKWPN